MSKVDQFYRVCPTDAHTANDAKREGAARLYCEMAGRSWLLQVRTPTTRRDGKEGKDFIIASASLDLAALRELHSTTGALIAEAVESGAVEPAAEATNDVEKAIAKLYELASERLQEIGDIETVIQYEGRGLRWSNRGASHFRLQIQDGPGDVGQFETWRDASFESAVKAAPGLARLVNHARERREVIYAAAKVALAKAQAAFERLDADKEP